MQGFLTPMSEEKSNIAGPDAPNRPVLLPGVAERLRTARTRIGLKQFELAEAGGVSRATQVSYEAGTTEPTTQYLRDIQKTGIDLSFILFGIKERDSVSTASDWTTLHQAVEALDDFFRLHRIHAPSPLRRLLVESLYDDLLVASKDPNSFMSSSFIAARAERVWLSLGLPKLPIPASTVFTL